MLVPQGQVRDFFVALQAAWNVGLGEAETWYEKISERATSTTTTERYWWVDAGGEMERWVGARELDAIHARTFDVTNDDWQKAYAIKSNDIADAQVGLYAPVSRSLGFAASTWPQTMVRPWLLQGHTKLCYDGQPFFDEDHPVSLVDSTRGVYRNYFTNTAFNANNWKLVSRTMKTFKKPTGEFYGLRPTHVLHAADIETEVRQLFNTTLLAATSGLNTGGQPTENVYTSEAIPVMIPDLPEGWWITVCMNRPIKPFVYQVRQDPQFLAQMDPTGPRYWSDKEYAFGVDARGEATGTMPVLAILSRPDAG